MDGKIMKKIVCWSGCFWQTFYNSRGNSIVDKFSEQMIEEIYKVLMDFSSFRNRIFLENFVVCYRLFYLLILYVSM